MSLAFSIIPKTSATRSYLALGLTTGIYAISFDAGAKLHLNYRYHHPGVAGQYLVREQQTGRSIAVVVRYVGPTVGAAEASYKSDCDVYAAEQVAISVLGQNYLGCNLVPGSMYRTKPIRATGRTAGYVYFDATMAFTQDNPAGN